MAAFELPTQFRDKTGGAVAYDTRQLYPITSALSGQRPGVTAPAVGQTTYQWNDDSLWWVPALSWFSIRGHFTDGSGNALARPPTSSIGYVDDWPSVLFSQIQMFCNSQTVELLQAPPIADVALLYTSVDKTYLDSTASASGVGEPYQQRILNSAQFGTGSVSASNYNEIVATWRPSVSLFDTATGLPPGQQWRIDFSWSNTAEQNMIESITSKIAGTDFFFYIDSFTFFKATLRPDVSVPLPKHGLIELNPVQVNTYSMVRVLA